MKLTEAAAEGFKLGEDSTAEYSRTFVCNVMRNILAMHSLVEIQDYCEHMIEVNTFKGIVRLRKEPIQDGPHNHAWIDTNRCKAVFSNGQTRNNIKQICKCGATQWIEFA